MKLMLRPEWRLWPLSSFLGFLDLKTGVTVALLFAVLNKVAGVYGLIAVLTGAGGTFAQLSLYIYSAIALIGLVWGLRVVREEDAKQTLYFAHLFFADHIFSTSWTVFFAVVWWVYTPHDGRRTANSKAQQAMMDGAISNSTNFTPAEREAQAMAIWNQEKGTAATIIILSWLFKIYFVFLLYSYASHLRKGSYRSLPLSRSSTNNSNAYVYESSGLPEEEDEEIEDFYRVPLRSHRGNGSISTMSDFVNAPGRAKKPRSRASQSNSRSASRTREGRIRDEEVLFDDNESTAYASSSRAHSRGGTEESTPVNTDDERTTKVRY